MSGIKTLVGVVVTPILVIFWLGVIGYIFLPDSSGPSRSLPPTVVEEDGYYVAHYEWSYMGTIWSYDGRFPKETYEFFLNKSRTSDYAEYVNNPADDEWMDHLADLFENTAENLGWGEFETVSFVLAFVQSMPYTSDKVTTGYDEWPRYPIETIIEGGGDCEDSSILFASIARGMGYEVVLLKLEEDEHMGVGVEISQDVMNNWNRSYTLTYYESEGKIYAYCETTGEGWQLGRKPEDLVSVSATVIDVY